VGAADQEDGGAREAADRRRQGWGHACQTGLAPCWHAGAPDALTPKRLTLNPTPEALNPGMPALVMLGWLASALACPFCGWLWLCSCFPILRLALRLLLRAAAVEGRGLGGGRGG